MAPMSGAKSYSPVVERLRSAASRVLGSAILEKPEMEALACYLEVIPRTRDFTHLPPLLGSDRALPIATMYVELSVSRVTSGPAPRLLSPTRTLAQAMEERHRQRTARRLSVAEAIGAGRNRTVVLLGDPGSGKTSLLKRIALDVAEGAYPAWIVPLHVPLRVYWENRRRFEGERSPLGLLRYAAIRAVGANQAVSDYGTHVSFLPRAIRRALPRVEAMEEILHALAGEGVMFLLDALDEIATSPDAVSAITEEISALGAGFAWVVTSRRAGFFGGLGEEARFEIVDLDEASRARVVHNWFSHQGASDQAGRVIEQVEADDRLRSMARSPFLLTLLCHLHHAGGEPLPLVRAEAYDAILRSIRVHFNHSQKDERAFTEPHLDTLAGFLHWLYTEAPDAPRNLFGVDDWDAYGRRVGWDPPPPLRTPYLASRLLDRWSQDSDYHLVHLTLQEHLVARWIVAAGIAGSLHRVHAPAFREVFRFAAGMLRRAEREQDLAALLRAVLEPMDLLGMVFVEAARLLAEAGIVDTRPLLGTDLREKLWHIWATDTPYLAEAAGEALGLFAPDFVLSRVEGVLSGHVPLPRAPRDALAELWHDIDLAGQLRVEAPRGANAVIFLLAEVRDKRAEDRLLELMTCDRGDAVRADLAAYALARTGSARVRREIVRCASGSAASHELKYRAYRYAIMAPHEDLLTWLIAELEASPLDDAEQILRAMRAIASPVAAPAIARWLRGCREAPPTLRADALRALAILDRRLAQETLAHLPSMEGTSPQTATAEIEPEVPDTAARGLMEAALGLLDEPSVCAALAGKDSALVEAVLDAAGDAAEEGELIGVAVRDAVARLCEDSELGERALNALARIEVRRSAANEDVRWLSILRAALASGDDSRTSIAAHALGELGDAGSAAAVLAIATDEGRTPEVRMTACGALGRIGRAEPGSARALEMLVTSVHQGLAGAAADALGRLDLPALIRLREAPSAVDALARACAEHGLLVFRDELVDASGQRRRLVMDEMEAPAARPPDSADPRIRVIAVGAPEDANWCAALGRHLSPLARSREIEIWSTARGAPGEDLDAETQRRIEGADVVLVMVSAYLWECQSWSAHGSRILERDAEGRCRVIPVLARPCILDGSALEGRATLPENGVALALWPDVEDGLAAVARSLTKELRSSRDPGV